MQLIKAISLYCYPGLLLPKLPSLLYSNEMGNLNNPAPTKKYNLSYNCFHFVSLWRPLTASCGPTCTGKSIVNIFHSTNCDGTAEVDSQLLMSSKIFYKYFVVTFMANVLLYAILTKQPLCKFPLSTIQ